MKIIKFGGTSIGTPERFLYASKIILKKSEEEFSIVVLSAIGGITDKLLETIDKAGRGDQEYLNNFGQIRSLHYNFLSSVVKADYQKEIILIIDNLLNQLGDKLKGIFLLNECSNRISDSIVTYGEYLSNILMVGALRSNGKKCEFHDARKLIRTNSIFGDAEVNFDITDKLLHDWYDNLDRDQIAVVNGFTGSDKNGHITTLGRSGSDYTATIIGGILNATIVEIWTDVDGVLSADPKIVPSAKTLEGLSYLEASCLAVLGGKVIHPKTISPVERRNVPVCILNTFNPENKGTYIGNLNNADTGGIKTITYLQGLSSVCIWESESRYGKKILARLFGLIARLEIPIITISKSAYNQTISFVLQNEFEQSFLDEIKREFVLEFEKGFIAGINLNNNLVLVSLIGAKRESSVFIERRVYDVLENNEIKNVTFLNDPGSLNLSFLIDEHLLSKTVASIHDNFFETELASNVA
ncbi:MAG: hypothetical protein CVV24_01385 [Ignavibacteriae bacterium HGW-Ignavibacteriae-3]|nr:MAG: hypothetical protein CVV24_01385 [Ignavibacteriae bacterium HGW-Ignavibacteriae-3]